jgi:hypothetical protein
VPPDATGNWTTTPRVLFVYYSYTQQTQRVVDAMSDVLPIAAADHEGREASAAQDGLRGAWAFAGGQMKSLLSLLSYLGHGENRDRYLGVGIPPTNLRADDLAGARSFASGLAAGIAATHRRTEGVRSGTG